MQLFPIESVDPGNLWTYHNSIHINSSSEIFPANRGAREKVGSTAYELLTEVGASHAKIGPILASKLVTILRSQTPSS